LGSTADENEKTPICPLDTTTTFGTSLGGDRPIMNLSTIRNPAEFPLITMKNWPVVVEQLSREFSN
jgi:hypothetical protein